MYDLASRFVATETARSTFFLEKSIVDEDLVLSKIVDHLNVTYTTTLGREVRHLDELTVTRGVGKVNLDLGMTSIVNDTTVGMDRIHITDTL